MQPFVADFPTVIVGFRQWKLTYAPHMPLKNRFSLIAPFVNQTWHLDNTEVSPKGFLKAVCDQKYKQFFTSLRHKRNHTQVLASCPLPLHDAPDKDCSCGFHAYHDPLSIDLLTNLQNGLYSQKADIKIMGICQMAGKSQLHQNGIRAQYIRVAALLIPPPSAFSALGFHFAQSMEKTNFFHRLDYKQAHENSSQKIEQIQKEFLVWTQKNNIDLLSQPAINAKGKIDIPEDWFNKYGKTIPKNMVSDLWS